MRWKLMVGGGVGSLEGYNCKEQKRNEKNLWLVTELRLKCKILGEKIMIR